MEQAYFAVVYPDINKVWAALDAFKKLHRSSAIDLKRAAIAIRQRDGHVSFEETGSLEMNFLNPKYGMAGLAGSVAGAIGAAPLGPAVLVMAPFMGAVGATAAIGYDLMQRQSRPSIPRSRVEDALAPGSSALVVDATIYKLEEVLQALTGLGQATLVELEVSPTLSRQLEQAVKA